MAGLQHSDVKCGMSVFARVSGFPWWPAQVRQSPHTGEYVKNGKFWVSFFNDHTGAWLKPAGLRLFDPYHKDLCLEYNDATPKWKRYKDKLTEAIKLAEAHATKPKQATKVRVLPPGGGEGEVVCIDQLLPQPLGATPRRRPGRPPGKRKPSTESRNATLNLQEKQDKGGEIKNEKNGASGEGDDANRPRRKRMRSSRYEEYAGPVEGRNGEQRASSAEGVASPRRGAAAESGPLAAWTMNQETFNSTALKKRIQRTKCLHGGKEEKAIAAGNDHLRGEERQSASHRSGDNPADTQSDGAKRGRGRGRRRKPSLRGEEAKPENVISVDARWDQRGGMMTREKSKPKVTTVGSARATEKDGAGGRATPLLRRSVRSWAGRSSESRSTLSEDGTDSEEQPERERLAAAGSLVGVAESLVECAIRRDRKRSRSRDRAESAHQMQALALGSTGMVTSILNRISDLEHDVMALRDKTTAKQQATFGEDASAAGLKSAVEALASASLTFAKARDYNAGVICNSLQLLWTDGDFPLPGADGEFLQTVARSLVLASCKRRHDQVVQEDSDRLNRQHKEEREEADRSEVPVRSGKAELYKGKKALCIAPDFQRVDSNGNGCSVSEEADETSLIENGSSGLDTAGSRKEEVNGINGISHDKNELKSIEYGGRDQFDSDPSDGEELLEEKIVQYLDDDDMSRLRPP